MTNFWLSPATVSGPSPCGCPQSARGFTVNTSPTDKRTGIWDCQSSQAVVEFVRRGIAAKQDLDKICENMMDNCLASNSGDRRHRLR